jgi:hypothetical protein
MPTLIRPLAEGHAGEASWISVQAFNDREVVTALRNGSGNLHLISWHTEPGDTHITRGADSVDGPPIPPFQTGKAREVALALMGRTAITAVRSDAGRLLLITWDVPPGLATMRRVWDSGTSALEARLINVVAVSDTILVTAVRAGNGDLLLIPWRLDWDQTLVRLDPEGVRAADLSNVTIVTMARVDANNVVTAIRTSLGFLELIGWSVSDTGEIKQWAAAPATAGLVTDIALVTVRSDAVTTDIVTAVKNGSGNLQLIAWRLSPANGTIVRLTPDGIEAGTASDITLCMGITEPDGRPTIVASMRRGSDNLEIITYELLANGTDGATFVRTGEAENKSGTDVTWTSLAALDPGRIISAIQVDDDLQLTTYSLSAIGTTLIKPLAEASAGKAGWIAARAFNENEALTALRNDSGNLELIGWLTAPGDFAITRVATNSDHDGFAAQEVSLEVMGRSAITAVRNHDDRLQLDVWSVPDGLASMDWISDSGDQAGKASNIAIVALSDTLLVTAVRADNGELLLIPWALTSSQTLSRLDPEGVRPRDDSDVSFVTIARIDANNVVTAVRNDGNLELIGWSVSDAGQITQWSQSPGYAGIVADIALASIGSSDGSTTDVVTAVQNGKGNLLLIAWRLSPADGKITRLTPDGFEGGPASVISVCMIPSAPSGAPTILTSMRRSFTRVQGQNIQHVGTDNLAVIAFELLPDGSGGVAFVRTGDLSNAANTKVAETAFAPLETGRVLSVLSMDDALQLTTYSITDAAITPAPSTILDLQYLNSGIPASTDTSWAKSHGTYPSGSRDEWVQVLAPHDDYETTTLVGAAGWVVAPEMSGADMPFSHPFGFDWEFEIVLDDANGYQDLLSPASAAGGDDPNHNPILLANALGISAPRGLLGMEWDKNLLPQSLRARVDHGDRVALLGRWIIDEGHDSSGFYRTEIHPPLVMATGSIEHDVEGIPFTRVLFMSRPFLCGQTYVEDADDAYDETVETDGSLLDHLIGQIKDLFIIDSSQVEVHPRIMPRPFQGCHHFEFTVRPPPLADPSKFELAVSFRFTTRHGCSMRVSGTEDDHAISIAITLDSKVYVRPNLPERSEHNYFPDELDTLSPGAGWKNVIADAIASALAGVATWWTGPWIGAYVTFILFFGGIQTDEYAKLDEIDILDAAGAVENALADNIPAAHGIISNDAQPYPFYGWMEARWVPRRG